MEWAKPPESKGLVTRAGEAIRCHKLPVPDKEALSVVNAWRAAHSFPLNTFQVELRRRAKLASSDATVAQRIKRLESIHAKLVDKPSMRLTQMQDIGGCRAVVGGTPQLRALVSGYESASTRLKHQFHHQKDYIAGPKADGYRSQHLIYQYSSRYGSAWDGLFIEIQVRTRVQHAWATAVETVDTFTRQGLKARRGDERWRRFFALVSTAVAAFEYQPSVIGTPTNKAALIEEIAHLERELGVVALLTAHQKSIDRITSHGRADYYVIEMNFDEKTSNFLGFSKARLLQAQTYVTLREQQISEDQNIQIVLVASSSIKALQRAYPNYLLDTTIFVAFLEDYALMGNFPDPQPVGPPADA